MERLYWTQADFFEGEVEVKVVGDNKVVIKPIVFHPEEGGQPADKGVIGEAVVLGVEVVEGQVVHTLDRPLGKGKYIARVDKEHRLYTASQHTAQHILSGVAQKQFGLKTTGVHIGPERCTVDFDKKIDWETIQRLERQSNEAAGRDLPVETVFNEPEVRIRSALKEIKAALIRVVKIADIDKSACCGAHLSSTGQVGMIRLTDMESKKEGARVFFLAGVKALEFSQDETSVLRELRKAVRCSTAELAEIVQKNLEQISKLNREVNRLWSEGLADMAKAAQVVELESSKVGIQIAQVPSKLVAKLAAMIAGEVEGVGIVVSEKQIAINSNSLDAGGIFKKIQKATGGKGGGSAKAANGQLAKVVTREELVEILQNG